MRKLWTNLFNYDTWYMAYLTGMVTFFVSLIWFEFANRYGGTSTPSVYDFFGTWLNLWCVWLTLRQNNWCWPTGLLGVVFFGISCYNYQLYSSVVLNLVYYVPVQFYGWWQWMYGGKDKSELTPIWSSWRDRLATIAGVTGAVFLWGMFLSTYTDAKMIFLDAAIMGMSIVAQLIMSWKRIESWILWITVDFLCVFMFFFQGAYMFSALYAVFFCLASKGLYDWLTQIKKLS